MSMTSAIETCATLLTELIGYRTSNPGGDELALCERLARELRAHGPDDVVVGEVPRPGRETGGYVFARYGTPRTVINVHLDTVPPNTGWSRDPFTAAIVDGRLYGLGSSDTKGAIAATLVALSSVRPRDVGILFSGDEENGAQCVPAFLASEHRAGMERVIVCEPTRRQAGVRHRGFRGYRAQVPGQGGHSSRADHMPKPVVSMARLAVGLDELGKEYLDQGPPDMRGLCMNVAAIEGGVALNVIPDSASMVWSVRPPPGFDVDELDRRITRMADDIGGGLTIASTIGAEPFACRDVDGFRGLIGAHVDDFVPLDFWTEAALWSAAGVDAVVVGPGDIGQAHAPDEFVTLDDLSWAIDLFTHVFRDSAQGA